MDAYRQILNRFALQYLDVPLEEPAPALGMDGAQTMASLDIALVYTHPKQPVAIAENTVSETAGQVHQADFPSMQWVGLPMGGF